MWLDIFRLASVVILLIAIGINLWSTKKLNDARAKINKNLADTDENLKNVKQLQADYIEAKQLLIKRYAAAIEGLQTTSQLMSRYKDKYLDMEVPENTEGPHVYEEFRAIQHHVEGSIIAARSPDPTAN